MPLVIPQYTCYKVLVLKVIGLPLNILLKFNTVNTAYTYGLIYLFNLISKVNLYLVTRLSISC